MLDQLISINPWLPIVLFCLAMIVAILGVSSAIALSSIYIEKLIISAAKGVKSQLFARA